MATLPTLITDLGNYVIPCFTIDGFRFLSRMMCPFLDRFDGSMFNLEGGEHILLPRHDQKHYIINHILMSSLGVQLDPSSDLNILNWDFY
jgi:hypothetical protein